jgi:hypothetical protein
MTTIRQINKLVKPLAGSGREFVQKEWYIFHTTIHHVINRIDILRTSEANHFRVIWKFCPSFSTGFTLEWEKWFEPGPHQFWFWSTPDIDERFIACVNEQVLPCIRGTKTLDDFVKLVTEADFIITRLADHVDTDIRVDIARGDLDTARMKCRALHERCARDPESYWGRIWRRTTDRAGPLLEADDRPALIALLHEWERELIGRLGLEAIYEPTPFPLELAPDLNSASRSP